MLRPWALLAVIWMPSAADAQGAAADRRLEIVPDHFEWRSSGSGISIARVEGDPSVPDAPYTLALRLDDGAWIPPHWHPKDKRILVVSGTVLLGWGEAIDEGSIRELPPGAFALVPGADRHYEGARGVTVFVLYGIGPLTTTFVGSEE